MDRETTVVSLSQRLGALMVATFAVVFTRMPWPIDHVFNPLLRRLLMTPVPAGPNVLLTVPGRRTGVPRTVPVSFLDLGDRGLIQAASRDGDWVRNLRAAGEAVIRRGGRDEKYHAAQLAPDTAGRVVHDLLAPFPLSRLLRAVVGPVNRPPVAVLHRFRLRVDDTLDEYVALAGRQPVFELRKGSGAVAGG